MPQSKSQKLLNDWVLHRIVFDHNITTLEINNKNTTWQPPDIWKPRDTCPNHMWVKTEISVGNGKYFELDSNENIVRYN